MNMQNRNNDNRLGHRKSRRWSARSMIVGTAALAATLASTVPAVATTAHKATHGSVSAPFYTATTSKSFSSATASLKTAVSSAGMMVLGQLNQAGALSITGLHLNGAASYFVGNPTTGKSLFEMNSAIGIEIPLDIYLWVNAAGKTQIGYFKPAEVMTAISGKFASSSSMFDKTAASIVRATK